MEFYEYPLLHEADLMLTLVKIASDRPATIDDAVARLKQNLQSVNETPPVDDAEMREHLERTRLQLVKALLLESLSGGRFRTTARGLRVLAEHPAGIDTSVLMEFPEYRAFVDQQAASRPHPGEPFAEGASEPVSDDPRTKEFAEGYAAFQSGLGLDTNPYEADRVMHLAWQNGWSQARDDAQREQWLRERGTQHRPDRR